jgi:hypothetical protein
MFAEARAAMVAELGLGLDGQVAARAGGPGGGGCGVGVGFRFVVDLGDGSVLRLAQYDIATTGQRGQ